MQSWVPGWGEGAGTGEVEGGPPALNSEHRQAFFLPCEDGFEFGVAQGETAQQPANNSNTGSGPGWMDWEGEWILEDGG